MRNQILVFLEKSNLQTLRSILYTDENPKGTIHGLGFKDVATAKASVSKIRNSSQISRQQLLWSKEHAQRQQLLWNREQERWVRLQKQQSIEIHYEKEAILNDAAKYKNDCNNPKSLNEVRKKFGKYDRYIKRRSSLLKQTER